MGIYDSANRLAQEIRESEEVREVRRLRQIAEADDTNRALLEEYRRLQLALQMQAMGGPSAGDDAMDRFSKISSLLYMNQDVQAYLMAEMRMQKLMADVLKIISEAAGMNLDALGGA